MGVGGVAIFVVVDTVVEWIGIFGVTGTVVGFGVAQSFSSAPSRQLTTPSHSLLSGIQYIYGPILQSKPYWQGVFSVLGMGVGVVNVVVSGVVVGSVVIFVVVHPSSSEPSQQLTTPSQIFCFGMQYT